MTDDIQGPAGRSRDGATVAAIIQHDVRPENRAAYERWLGNVSRVAKDRDGHVTTAVTRPRGEGAGTYSIVLQFDDAAALDGWLGSDERARWIDRADDLIEKETVDRTSALEDLVLPQGTDAPPRWKTALLTFLGVCFVNVVLGVTGVTSLIYELPSLAAHAISSGLLVAALAWLVMPVLSRWAANWLRPS